MYVTNGAPRGSEQLQMSTEFDWLIDWLIDRLLMVSYTASVVFQTFNDSDYHERVVCF